MPLTVKDILEKTFKRSFKGYDEDEVDKFLDQIIDEFKAVQSENESLKQALDVEKQRVAKVRDTEETIMNTLVSAQKSAERILNDAARKAEMIIDSAENTAKQKKEQVTSELAEAEEKLSQIRESAGRFAESFANMINSQASAFEKTYRSYFGNIDPMAAGGMNIDSFEGVQQDIAASLGDQEEDQGDLAEEFEAIPDTGGHAALELEEEEPEPETAEEASGLEISEEAPRDEEPEQAPEKKGLMELQEINQALRDIEKNNDVLDYADENKRPKPEDQGKPQSVSKKLGGYKPKYDDYSWLYESEDKPGADDFELTVKDPKEKEELKSLIDEIID